MSTVSEPDLFVPRNNIKRGEPAWDIALLFPPQGYWSEEEYLALDTNWLVEFVDGCLEVLPMPSIFHQLIVRFLYELLQAHVTAGKAPGLVLFAPLRVRLWKRRIREPDVVYIRPERIRGPKKPPDGADLVMEVVSGGAKARERDLETKRAEYARAGIPEYWIVDPDMKRLTVLTLRGKKYRSHGVFAPGDRATSALLPGFTADVTAVFAAGEITADGGEPPPNQKPKRPRRKPKTGG